jgi:cysteine-rich repeat protein
MGTDLRSSFSSLVIRVLAACLVTVTLCSTAAFAENCGPFDPCSSSNDYCTDPVFGGTCKAKGDAGDSCNIIAVCKSGLVCDLIGECRHSPPQSGEPCGIGVPCASGLTCSADIGGRCQAPGQSGDACSGIGQGSCAAGLVCDANRTCRHDPPQAGEPCGVGVECAGDLVCSSPVAGTCEARGQAGDSCIGIGQGTCASGLVCDALLECRHSPPELGEPCGVGVECAGDLACSSPVAGRCEARGQAGDFCYGIGQGTCESGLVCDASFQCRHDPPERGEPCGIGVSCAGSLVCSADVAGTCGDRGGSGDSCSGIGQGSCQAGLVCGVLRECRHDPPELDETCGPFVPCADGLFCQGGTQRCKEYKTVGEGCSAFNLCAPGLACDPCFTSSCNYPLQCFPNANDGVIDQQTCLTLYSKGLHQAAKDIGLAMTYGAGDGFAAVFSESQQIGVLYDGADGRYGCFSSICAGISSDLSISAFLSLGFYNDYDSVAGTSYSIVESAGAGVVSFSTSQIFALSLDPFVIGNLIGTEDVFAAGVSPEDAVLPVSLGEYTCATVVDTVIGGAGQPVAALCGDGFIDDGEACDDGNTVDGDGCSSVCTIEALCGNGTIDVGEGCDDGNTSNGDGCSAVCQVEPICGDGNLDLGEECDDGNNLDGDGCSATCTIQPYCGDGTVDPGEQCDDGNQVDGDGCSATCVLDGNYDGDADVDRNDLSILMSYRNMPASECTTCDLDGDGMITSLDARILVLMCTRPYCATE